MDALKIHFGPSTTWELPEDARIASFASSPPVVDDIAAAVAAALSQPIDFPSLDQAVVAGDRLVLAIDPELPALTEVVCATASWFAKRGTTPANMHIVIAGHAKQLPEDLHAALESRLGAAVSIETHDPDDPEKLAYVAANEDSDPIYMNRSIVDADVVFPISCARPCSSLDYLGAYSLFPLLSDRATRGSFYSLPKLDDPLAHAKLRSWADQAAWWVGLVAGIQVVPAGHNQVAAILAGQTEPLEQASQEAMTEAWNTPAAVSDMVVALIDGPPAQQTWLAFARALHMASKCVTQRGTIVICSELSQGLGKGLSRLRDAHRSPETIAKQLSSDTCDDAIAAAVILQATSNFHVYLVSQLRSESVESLALGVVSDEAQLARLVEQHTACTLLGSAQYRGLALCAS